MSDEQNEPVRSRDRQIVGLGARIFVGMRNHTDSMCEAQRHIDEAEARGAAEQWRKDGEALLDPATVHQNILRGSIVKLSWEAVKHLYPTNVAALEARVKELEGERDSLKKQIQALRPGSIRPVIHSPTRFKDESRAALKREGGEE